MSAYFSKIMVLSKEELISELWRSNEDIKRILRPTRNLHKVREGLFNYLNDLERHYYNLYSAREYKEFPSANKSNAKECIRVLKNIIRTENEKLSGSSALKTLIELARNGNEPLSKVSKGFLVEFIFLFRGISGKLFVQVDRQDLIESINQEASSTYKSRYLDQYSTMMIENFNRYEHGLSKKNIRIRKSMKERILKYFNGSEKDWTNYKWHLKHIIKSLDVLSDLVVLNPQEIEGIRCVTENDIPFHITPYYLSLFNSKERSELDRAIRAQVLPSLNYCKGIIKTKKNKSDLDFMGEKWTSPIENITRRYPQIVVLKPYNSCPQICVYCQRNWEIKSLGKGNIRPNKLSKALQWIKDNPLIREVLITGGDPLTLDNSVLDTLLKEVSQIDHIERIRIGTRTLVTLPFRFNKELINILKKYHRWGKREVCIITHFEHVSEITPDVLKVIKRIKSSGINIYNQQVFTYFNSRRFESAFLRSKLKLCGIDPYYTFNTKGKAETVDFRVPIARIEQERREEARLLPGIVRTDEPVFNVPRIGKSHLRAWQDHEPISILPDGSRVYCFHPWESKTARTPDYIYTDVPIYNYLQRLISDGENIEEYKMIWYYF